MKKNKSQAVKKKSLDIYWSELIKHIAGGACEYCGEQKFLNSHHVFSRSNHSIRWDENNGVCLCAKHHVLGNWSAHKSPLEFAEWLIEKRGKEWYEELKSKSKEVVQDSKLEQREVFEKIKQRLGEYRLKEDRNENC